MVVASWHKTQVALLALAPPMWPVVAPDTVVPAPVAKLMPSWQAPHASMLGTFFQLSPLGVTTAVPAEAVPVWHLVQLVGLCGNPTALNICAPPLLLKL